MYRRIKRLFLIYAACHSDTGQTGLAGNLRLLPGFIVSGARAFPHALRWIRFRDPAARARVKQYLDLSGPAPIALNGALLQPPEGSVVPDQAAVTIVMPVYGNLEMTQGALKRVVEFTDVPWRLILVDDASPLPQVRPSLRAFAKDHPNQVTLIGLDENQGFVGAANTGLKCALQWKDPVVLLNTDAFVPKDWASRLLAPIWRDDTVASVTPMSNDAELGCVPMISLPQPISAEQADKIDHHAREIGGEQGLITAPAGVGFCMAMARPFLDLFSQFDTAFAPGYGEEVDWCQKVAKRGGKNVYVPNLFVAHMGGQSFGSETKARLIARNSEVLSQRYPHFNAHVFGFMRNDPLVTTRLRLGLVWAIENDPEQAITIFIGHTMGGGAEIDLMRRIDAEVDARGAAVVVRLGGVFRFSVELWWRGHKDPVAAGMNDWAIVEQLLRPLRKRHVVYSNAVGDPFPIEIPTFLIALSNTKDATLTVLVHDYLILSPSITLLGQADKYIWPSDPTDPRNQSRAVNGSDVSLTQWRTAWRPVLERAHQVVCFSRYSLDLVAQVYGAGCALACEPHDLPVAVPAITPPKGRAVLGVLGNISPHKGAAILQECSARLKDADNLDLVLLGDLDPGYRLHRRSLVHGIYDVTELPELVHRYGITCWLIPSIWPETFSFTTHEAIATGLPVIVFDLGAQRDAVHESIAQGGQGVVLDVPLRHTTSQEIIKTAVFLSK